MKKVVFYILLPLIAITTSCGNASKSSGASGEAAAVVKSAPDAPKEKRLPFERGSYQETTNAMGIGIDKTVYFDKWGDWTATESKSEIEIIKGHVNKTDKLEIMKGSTHWNLDLIAKTGTTFEFNVPIAGMAASLGMAAMGGKMMEGMEIKDLGEENYLGYQCKKSQIKYAKMEMDATVLAYGNLTMKMNGKVGKMDVSTTVTAIDLSAPPASIFEVPADIVITKVEN